MRRTKLATPSQNFTGRSDVYRAWSKTTKLTQIALSFVVVCSLIGCELKGEDKISREQTAKGWGEFSSKQGRFTIKFPISPNETISTNETKLVGRYVIHLFGCENIKGAYYALMYFDIPTNVISKGADLIFNQSISALQKNDYSIDYSKEIKQDDFNGIEISCEKRNIKVVDRLFIVGNRHFSNIFEFSKGKFSLGRFGKVFQFGFFQGKLVI